MKVAFGYPRVAGAFATFAAVDVAPQCEGIERDVSEHAGVRGAVQVEHRRQVVVVAPACLVAGLLDLLPALCCAGSVGEVDHIDHMISIS